METSARLTYSGGVGLLQLCISDRDCIQKCLDTFVYLKLNLGPLGRPVTNMNRLGAEVFRRQPGSRALRANVVCQGDNTLGVAVEYSPRVCLVGGLNHAYYMLFDVASNGFIAAGASVARVCRPRRGPSRRERAVHIDRTKCLQTNPQRRDRLCSGAIQDSREVHDIGKPESGLRGFILPLQGHHNIAG